MKEYGPWSHLIMIPLLSACLPRKHLLYASLWYKQMFFNAMHLAKLQYKVWASQSEGCLNNVLESKRNSMPIKWIILELISYGITHII